MLRKSLLAAAGNQGGQVEFLGSVSANGTQTASSTPYDIDLTSLGLQEDDLLILSNAADGTGLSPIQISNPGWSLLYDGSTFHGDGDILYKFVGSTPDSDISLGTSDNAVICSAFRNAATFIQHTTETDVSGNPNPNATDAGFDSEVDSPNVAGSNIPTVYDDIYPETVVTTAISNFINNNNPTSDDIVYITGALDDDPVADTVTAPSGFTLVAAENATDGTGATAMAAYRYGTGSAINPDAFSSTGTDSWTASTIVIRSLNTTATAPTIDGQKYAGANTTAATVGSSDDNGSRLTVDLSNLSSVIGQANALAVVCVGGTVSPQANSDITNTSSTIFGQPGTNRHHETIVNPFFSIGAGFIDIITAEIPSGTSNTQITINYDRFTISSLSKVYTFILNGLDSTTPIFNSSTGPTANSATATLTPSAGGAIGIYMGLSIGDDAGTASYSRGTTVGPTGSGGVVAFAAGITTGNNTLSVTFDGGSDDTANTVLAGVTFT